MMDLASSTSGLASLGGFAAILAATPGPLTIALASIGARRGAVAGLRFLVGAAAAYAVIWSTSVLAADQIAALDSRLLDLMRVAGVLVVLWIAWRIASCFEDAGGSAAVPGAVAGVATTLSNPKAWISGAVAAIAFADPSCPASQVAAMHAGVIALVVLTCCGPWLVAGRMLGRLMRTAGRQRLFGRLAALALLGSVVPML